MLPRVGFVPARPFAGPDGMKALQESDRLSTLKLHDVGSFVVLFHEFLQHHFGLAEIVANGRFVLPDYGMSAVENGTVDTLLLPYSYTEERYNLFSMPIVIYDAKIAVVFRKLPLKLHTTARWNEFAFLFLVFLIQTSVSRFLKFNRKLTGTFLLTSVFIWTRYRSALYKSVVMENYFQKYGILAKSVDDLVSLIQHQNYSLTTVRGFKYESILSSLINRIEPGVKFPVTYIPEDGSFRGTLYEAIMNTPGTYTALSEYMAKENMHRLALDRNMGYFAVSCGMNFGMIFRRGSELAAKFERFLRITRETGVLQKILKVAETPEASTSLSLATGGLLNKCRQYAIVIVAALAVMSVTEKLMYTVGGVG